MFSVLLLLCFITIVPYQSARRDLRQPKCAPELPSIEQRSCFRCWSSTTYPESLVYWSHNGTFCIPRCCCNKKDCKMLNRLLALEKKWGDQAPVDDRKKVNLFWKWEEEKCNDYCGSYFVMKSATPRTPVKTADADDFPAVTMCSLNPFKKSKIHLVKELNNVQAAYNYATQKVSRDKVGETQRKRRDTPSAEVQKTKTEKRHSNEKRLAGFRNFTLPRMKRQSDLVDYDWKYKGCYGGHANGRLLMGKYVWSDQWRMMLVNTGQPASVESCLSFCRGHRFAGIEAGYGCMCGDEQQFVPTLLPDSDCNVPCQDTSALQTTCAAQFGCPANCGTRQCCGAGSIVSLYETTYFPNPGEFVACIPDTAGARVVPDKNNYQEQSYPTTVIDLSLANADVNINTCMEFCRGYDYMGVNYNRFCTCALGPDSIRNQPIALDPSVCIAPCVGGGLKSECAHFGCDRDECPGEGQCCAASNIVAAYRIHGCHLPALVGTGLYSIPSVDFAFVGETIEFACESGYSMEPGTETTWYCNTMKQLEGTPAPVCRPDCVFSDHTIPLGRALTAETALPFGSTVSFECLDPVLQEVQGESVIQCLADGLWSHPAPMCVAIPLSADSVLPLQFDINQLTLEQEAAYQSISNQFELEWDNITGPVSFRLCSLGLQAQSAVQDIVRNIPEPVLWNMTESAAELFPFCRFNGDGCDFSAIKSLPHPQYGRCHVFTNTGANGLKAGQKRGLETAIVNEPEEELLTSEFRGGRLILHPFPDISGVSVASGFSYIISFSKHVVNYLPGTCHNNGETFESIYPPEYDYSEEVCFRTCAAKYVYATCNCTDTRYPYPEEAVGVASCKAGDECYQKAMLYSVKKCDMCRRKCRMVLYPVSVSATAWPLENSIQHMKEICTDPMNTTLCNAQIRNNIMLLDIRPSLAQYEEITEALVKTMGQLFNDCSNAVSIWIGLSYYGIMEIAYAVLKVGLKFKKWIGKARR